jgi:hypothetical protein
VIVYVPGKAVGPAVNVRTLGAAPPAVVGLKLAVTPVGRVDVDSDTGFEKPSMAVTEILLEAPAPSVAATLPGLADKVKPWTVTDAVALLVTPLTVTVYGPPGVVAVNTPVDPFMVPPPLVDQTNREGMLEY